MLCFTGSTKVGKHLYTVAAEKFISVVLEMGGSAPGVIFADADIASVVDSIYANRFMGGGQMCDGLKRLIVHKSRFYEVVKLLKAKILSKKIGDASNPSTEVGPLVAERQVRSNNHHGWEETKWTGRGILRAYSHYKYKKRYESMDGGNFWTRASGN